MTTAASLHALFAAAAIAVVVPGAPARGGAPEPQAPAMAAGQNQAASLRARGLELGYNLDHAEALEVFKEAIAAEPAHPAGYRLVAATLWINVLFRKGAVTAEDFLGQAGPNAGARPKPVDLDARFRESLDRAISLAETRLRDRGASDVDAHYQIGAAYGFLASYTATVEGSLMSAMGPSRRAYAEHNRVLELDPARRDAGLIVGLYRYGVSTLGLFTRLVANLAGFSGGRERGIRLVEDAAALSSDVQTNARFALIVIYNREARYADALRVIGQLQQQFPRNRLLWLEAGSAALRAGRPGEANQAIEQGLAKLAMDSRPRAFGEPARWRYQHGLALAALNRVEEATSEFRAALSGESLDWIRGRTHLELGKLAELTSDRSAASHEFRQAAEICAAAKDSGCLKDARAGIRRSK